MGSHTFTRQELYDLVWSEPMRQIAKRHGMSDRGLAKACARAGIPVPERGYWARVGAGQQRPRPPLPPRKADESERIAVHPQEPKADKPAPPPVPPSVQARIDEERQSGRPAKVPATLANPHRIVAAWIEEDRRRQEEARRDPFMRNLHKQPTEVAKRRWRILSALFKALEERNYRLVVERQYYAHAVQIELKHVRFDVDLSERIRQYRRYLDEAEVRKRGDLSTGRKWSQEREATGELVCKMKVSQGYGWAEEWRDLPDRPLEEQINDILAGVAGGFEAIRLKREQEAEEASRRWELQRERERQENERKRELIRYRRLMGRVKDWEQAGRIRNFVVAVGALIPPDSTSEHRIRFDAWSSWALSHADRIDPPEDDSLYDREVTDSELWRLRD